MSESDSIPRVLIVDESRMARAMLARQIRNYYAFREEANGELAWQALLVDPTIRVVVCSLSMPLLNGDALLEKMRASALSRLAQMPILLIVGDDAEAVARAKSHGATEFIDRQALADELLPRLNAILGETAGDAAARATDATATGEENTGQAESTEKTENTENTGKEKEASERTEKADLPGVMSKVALLAMAKQAMGRARANHGRISALVMEFDNVADLRAQHGDDMVQQLQQRFVAILSGRVRENDGLGRYVGDRLAIISPDLDGTDCEAFSNRLRKAIKKAKISTHGDRLSLSVSIGIGNFPADGVASVEALLELASRRLEEAQKAGGDCVIAADVVRTSTETLTVEQALALLETGNKDRVSPHLPALGYRLLPLLKLLDRELKLGLSLGGATAKLQAMMRTGNNTLNAPKVDT